MKLILPLYMVPENSVVTKPTGEKRYTVKDKIVVYAEEPEYRQELHSDGVKFLVSEGGIINAMNGDSEVAIHGTLKEIADFIGRLYCSSKHGKVI